jgi:hypothetical protein
MDGPVYALVGHYLDDKDCYHSAEASAFFIYDIIYCSSELFVCQ